MRPASGPTMFSGLDVDSVWTVSGEAVDYEQPENPRKYMAFSRSKLVTSLSAIHSSVETYGKHLQTQYIPTHKRYTTHTMAYIIAKTSEVPFTNLITLQTELGLQEDPG